jgi:hypothetical protein
LEPEESGKPVVMVAKALVGARRERKFIITVAKALIGARGERQPVIMVAKGACWCPERTEIFNHGRQQRLLEPVENGNR